MEKETRNVIPVGYSNIRKLGNRGEGQSAAKGWERIGY